MILNDILSPQRVRELLDYDPNTGVLLWRARPLRKGLERIDKGWNTRFIGKPAGRPDRKGYIWIGIAYDTLTVSNFAAHRLAWVHNYGEWPTQEIDHINRNTNDNRICNLRLATPTGNRANSKIRTNNKSGVKGVYWSRKSKKWSAFVTKDGREINLGTFPTLEAATAARKQAATEGYGEFASERDPEG